MYTGVVETSGEIRTVDEYERGCRIEISTDVTGIEPDGSVGISGVCLTAESVGDGRFEAFLSAETVERTYLAALESGDAVNVERSLPADDRFHGHVVKGTVDAVTEVADVEADGDGWRFAFAVPDGYGRYLVEKGAVAIDGVSLTVTDVAAETFDVAVVPTTYEVTTLSETSVGDPVHFEADLFAKYVKRQRAAIERRV